eukprot:1190121-Prorocentrum_minimum.AAC.5
MGKHPVARSLARRASPSLARRASPSLARRASPSLARRASPSLARRVSPSLTRRASPSQASAWLGLVLKDWEALAAKAKRNEYGFTGGAQGRLKVKARGPSACE